MEKFVEHCEWADTIENISVAKFYALDEDSDTEKHKNRSKFK